MKRHRQPRPSAPASGLPVTYIEAVEDRIVRTVAKYREIKANQLTAEGSHNLFEGAFFERLMSSDVTLDEIDAIVRMAREGHPSADRALRHFIDVAMNAHRFPQLSLCVQEYARKCMSQAPLSRGYPSQGLQVANDLVRNWGICFCMEWVKKAHPEVPLLTTTKQRRSAAALVGQAFELTEVQTRRIYQADGEIFEKLTDFFVLPQKQTNGAIPFVS